MQLAVMCPVFLMCILIYMCAFYPHDGALGAIRDTIMSRRADFIGMNLIILASLGFTKSPCMH